MADETPASNLSSWLVAAEEAKDELAAAARDAARRAVEHAPAPALDEAERDAAPAVVDPAAGEGSAQPPTRFHSTNRAQTSASGNPFLPATVADPDTDELDDLAPVMATGPAAPTGAPAPARPALRVPDRFQHTRAYPGLVVQVVGLHGGAGTSTVASLLGREAIDCGTGLAGLVDADLPVVFVARTHAAGLELVKRTAAQWASRGLEPINVLGVVLVDDAPTLSKGLHREVKSLERALPHSWRLGWSEDIRHSPAPPPEATGGRLRRIRKSLLDQARKLPRPTARQNNTTTKMEGAS